MSDGGANISRGLGSGAAQVYDTSSPVNMYAKLMQQQQLKRAAETKALTDEFGKLTPEGIRQQDIPIFIEQVNKWKSASIDANNEKDPVKKAIKTQEAEQERIKSYALKDYSKSEGKKRSDFASSMLIPNNRDNFTDDAIDKFRESDKYSVNDSRYLSDLTTLQQQIDGSTTISEISKINKILLDAAKPSLIQRNGQVGNNVGTFMSSIKEVPQKEQIVALSSSFDISPKLRAGLRQMFPQGENESNLEYKTRIIPEVVNQFPARESGEEKFVKSDDWKAKALFREGLIRARPDKSGVSPEDIQVGPKTFTGTKLPQVSTKTGKPIVDTTGKPLLKGKGVTADFPVYSTVNPTAFKMPQLSSVFDIKKGVNKPVTEGISASLTGIGYAKVKGGGTSLKATITTDDGDELMINPTDLPLDVRNDKFYKMTLDAVNSKFNENKKSSESSKSPDEAALEWLKSNPNSPDAKGVRELLKSKGVIK